jgi:hypothetical protein
MKLVGFITLRTDHIVSHNYVRNLPAAENIEDILYSFLQAKLSSYMVPAVRIISNMPLNTNKKINQQALAKMTEIATASSTSSKVAPRSDLEHALHEEFATVLKVQVGITDNFFRLERHSLIATQVISRINKRLEAGMTVKDLFEHPTIKELSRNIKPLLGSTPYAPIPRFQHNGPVVQSYAQARLRFLEQLYVNSLHYLIHIDGESMEPLIFPLSSPLSVPWKNVTNRSTQHSNTTL